MRCFAIFLFVLLVGPCSTTANADSRTAPKVILLVIDSLRFDHLGDNGYPHDTAPFLGQLMESGATFTQAFSPSNYTGCSVPAMFAGKPTSHMLDPIPKEIYLPESQITLAESFKAADFDTFLWSSNLHLNQPGFAQGFDSTHCDFTYTRGIVSIEGLIREMENGYTESGNPEFHYVHTMDVHFPYRPPHPYEGLFGFQPDLFNSGTLNSGSPKDVLGDLVKSNLPFFTETHRLASADIQNLIALYDAAIRYTDDYIPKLLDALDYDSDRDMLIVTADHGEQFYEHGWWGHANQLRPQETHVPLIIQHPDAKSHSVSGPVGLVDLYPTLCDLYNLPKPDGLTGKSLADAIKGESTVEGSVYCESPDSAGPSASIISGNNLYYYQSNSSIAQPWILWPHAQYLYDLDSDPACAQNLMATQSDLGIEMHTQLLARNQRWTPFTWELVQVPQQGVNLGPGLVRTASLHSISPNPPASPNTLDKGGVLLHQGQPSLEVLADISEPNTPHVLSLEYQYVSKQSPQDHISFTLLSDGNETPIWSYNVLFPAREPKHLRIRVDPAGTKATLKIQSIGKSQVRISNVSLNRLYLPELTPRPNEDLIGTIVVPKDTLPQAEKDALEALGYIQ